MKADRLIAAEELVAVAGYALGDLLAQKSANGSAGLPNPKTMIGVLAFYGLLGWTSALGAQAARLAASVGGVVMLLFLLRPTMQTVFTRVSSTLIGFISSGNQTINTTTSTSAPTTQGV